MSLEMVIPDQRECSGDRVRRRPLWPCGAPILQILSAFELLRSPQSDHPCLGEESGPPMRIASG